MMNITPTVKQLLIINVIFAVGTQFVPQAMDLLVLYYPENNNFQYWQLISYMFMHAGILHLFFNMFALYSFGSTLEHLWGSKKFVFFYISCGLGSAFLHTLVNYYQVQSAVSLLTEANVSSEVIKSILTEGRYDQRILDIIPLSDLENMFHAYNTPMLGASGAVYGLLVAFAFMFPNAQLGLMFIPVPIKAKYFVSGILLIDLFLGIQGRSIFGANGTGVAHFAHLGGAIIGFIMMWYWKKNEFNNKRWN